MSGFIGADPDELRALAGVLSSSAGTLEGERKRINGLVHTATWHGREADEFRSAWNSRYIPILEAAAQMLESASGLAFHEAEQQVTASSGTNLGVDGGSSSVESLGLTGVVGGPALPTWWTEIEHRASKWGWLAAPFAAGIPQVGGLISQAGTIDSDFRLLEAVGESHYQDAFNQVSDLASGHFYGAATDALLDDPAAATVPFLVGANITIWTDVEQAGRDINWTYTFSHLSALNPLSPGALAIYGHASEQAVEEVGGQIAHGVGESFADTIGKLL